MNVVCCSPDWRFKLNENNKVSAKHALFLSLLAKYFTPSFTSFLCYKFLAVSSDFLETDIALLEKETMPLLDNLL